MFHARSLIFNNGRPSYTETLSATGYTSTHALEDIRKSGVKRLAKSLAAHRGLNWRDKYTRDKYKEIAREILALYPYLANNFERRF